eukprot:scaffold50077_cov35-Tisochrysis_lutea.AAC.3
MDDGEGIARGDLIPNGGKNTKRDVRPSMLATGLLKDPLSAVCCTKQLVAAKPCNLFRAPVLDPPCALCAGVVWHGLWARAPRGAAPLAAWAWGVAQVGRGGDGRLGLGSGRGTLQQ